MDARDVLALFYLSLSLSHSKPHSEVSAALDELKKQKEIKCKYENKCVSAVTNVLAHRMLIYFNSFPSLWRILTNEMRISTENTMSTCTNVEWYYAKV